MVPVIIILLLIGSMLIVGSFLFRDVPESTDKDRLVEHLLQERISEAKSQLNDAAENSVGLVKNQTERELERLSNEKIMAVSEYSDQVMDEINKNHQEVMFLYSMLNDKQKELDSTVQKMNQTKRLLQDEEKLEETRKNRQAEVEQEKQTNEEESRMLYSIPEQAKEPKGRSQSKKDKVQDKKQYSNKERILMMSSEGMTSLDIARKLKLGIGEVRLVIDLNNTANEQEGLSK